MQSKQRISASQNDELHCTKRKTEKLRAVFSLGILKCLNKSIIFCCTNCFEMSSIVINKSVASIFMRSWKVFFRIFSSLLKAMNYFVLQPIG